MSDPLAVGDIHLSALRDDDAPLLHRWRMDPHVRDGSLSYPFPTSVEAEREWIRAFAPRGTPGDICLAVRNAEDDELFGYCQLRSIDWVSRVAEFGIVIGRAEARHRGVGRRALHLTMTYAVERLALRRLWLRVAAFNKAAISLYESSGFELEGRMVRHAYRNGELHDVLIYGWEPAASFSGER